MNNDIYHIDFTQIFPGALQHDPKILALAKGLAAELLTVSGHLEDVLIYSRFDQLPEELVDILAYDMHVDWYDYEDPLAVKRQTVKDSVKVHKLLGTKYAVETAIQALFPGVTVQEWFDYEGEPHHFRITIPLPGGITPEVLEDLKRRIWHVKRLSSWLDTIITETQMEGAAYITPILGRGLAVTQLPPLEPVMEPMQLHVTPVLGDGLAVTRLPPMEPDFPATLIAVRISAVIQNTMETRLPTLKDSATTITAVCRARVFGSFTTFTETKLPELKEEIKL